MLNFIFELIYKWKRRKYKTILEDRDIDLLISLHRSKKDKSPRIRIPQNDQERIELLKKLKED